MTAVESLLQRIRNRLSFRNIRHSDKELGKNYRVNTDKSFRR